jgi:hypothetical protein
VVGYAGWGGGITPIMVSTIPYMGKRYAGVVFRTITETGLTHGLVPQSHRLESHTPSMHIAPQLGRVRYGVGISAPGSAGQVIYACSGTTTARWCHRPVAFDPP